MFKKMNLFIRIITFGWARAISLFPFGIYIREDYYWDMKIRNHEFTHWLQQREMYILPFYLWYLLEWIVKLFIYGKHSYYNLSFEREARAGRKKPYGWITYI
jgi:hypothetical protein